MNEKRTVDILQRVPAILAVTANSYGLTVQAGGSRKPRAAAGERPARMREKGCDKPVAQR